MRRLCSATCFFCLGLLLGTLGSGLGARIGAGGHPAAAAPAPWPVVPAGCPHDGSTGCTAAPAAAG